MNFSLTPEQQQVSIDVELVPGFPLASVDSLHHQVATASDALGRHVKLVGSQVPADKDFELVWKPKAAAAPQTSLFYETVAGQDYLLAMVTPPTLDAAPKLLPTNAMRLGSSSGRVVR